MKLFGQSKKETMKNNEFKTVIVYGTKSGFPMTAMFLGNEWWLMSKDQQLRPLTDGDGSFEDYNLLCDVGDCILMKDLARMMGRALENPEDKINDVLRWRLRELLAQGVTLISKPQTLNLVLRLFSNEGTKRQGEYSIWCEEGDRSFETLFDLDCFEDMEKAVHWAQVYVEFFRRHGVTVNVKLKAKKEILDSLKEKPEDWNYAVKED